MLGCSKCGKSEEGLNITLYKSVPYCDECFALVLPPANVMCSFRCGRVVSEASELIKKQPLCSECKIKMNADVVKLSMDMDINKARIIDESVEIKTDIFNLETEAIVTLKATIEADATIENKAYALAEAIRNRFEHLRTVVFDLNQQLSEAGTKQRAIQIYLNNMANTLRASEREKLRIADINYKPLDPTKPKSVKSISTTGVSKKRPTNKEIAEAAKALGIQEFTFKAFLLQTGGDLETTVAKIKKSIESAKVQ